MSEDAPKNGTDDGSMVAAEYVLGLLGAKARDRFEARLETDPGLRAHVAFWQDSFIDAAGPVDEVTPGDHVLTAIEAALDGKPPPGSTTVRDGEGEWAELLKGVFKKTLAVDRRDGTESYLLRFEPGAVLPAHGHARTEECLVLEGELIIGKARFGPGDYHAAPPGVPHMPVTSETGAVVFIRGELHAG
ncbi:MAG: cupin domain-containing protein [Hyphomicrobiales bacterium]